MSSGKDKFVEGAIIAGGKASMLLQNERHKSASTPLEMQTCKLGEYPVESVQDTNELNAAKLLMFTKTNFEE